MAVLDPKTWRWFFPVAVGAVVLIAVIIGVVLAVNAHSDDTSLSGQLNKAMDTQGSVRIVVTESGYAQTYKMDTWEYSYDPGYNYVRYTAHYDNGSVVLKTYKCSSLSGTPDKDVKGTLAYVDYYSAANVVSVSYNSNGTVYTWYR